MNGMTAGGARPTASDRAHGLTGGHPGGASAALRPARGRHPPGVIGIMAGRENDG
jgi:hypothetical protein